MTDLTSIPLEVVQTAADTGDGMSTQALIEIGFGLLVTGFVASLKMNINTIIESIKDLGRKVDNLGAQDAALGLAVARLEVRVAAIEARCDREARSRSGEHELVMR